MTQSSATVQRKLAAIFAADVAGYSRLMGQDETGTLRTLEAHREVMDGLIAEHGGRIANTAGDSVLAEFPSAVDAVTCAVAVQEGLAEANESLPEDRRLQFRIGIHVGDVMVRGGDLFGDGVNIAARLQALAEPGGAVISGAAHDYVRKALPLTYADLGPQPVKNIDEPVRAYRVITGSRASPNQDHSLAKQVSLPLPDKPSIAVLPFTNMGGDPEQEVFGDGLVEDIITSLSKVSNLFVTARNSTFVFKGRAIDVREAARQLGVRYVLEGGLRKGGNRVRVTAQLIDGQTGSHVWAERYDRLLENIFDVQDEITREITTALQVRLTEGEQVELRRRQTSNLMAWEAYMRGQGHLRTFTRADNLQARALLERALSLDPSFAAAWALLAWTYLAEGRLGWSNSNEAAFEKGAEAALRGLTINENEPDAWAMLGGIRLYQRRYEEAIEGGQRSIALAPNVADHHVLYALTLNFIGRPQEAMDLIERAMRLSPFYPDWYLGILGISYRLLGRIDDALATDHERLRRNPANAFSDLRLAALYSHLGQIDRAQFHLREALRKNPSYSVRQVRVTDPYQDEVEMERYLNLLRAAGLPE